jgi:RNA polymerase sigma factor for flagellar operon FliA
MKKNPMLPKELQCKNSSQMQRPAQLLSRNCYPSQYNAASQESMDREEAIIKHSGIVKYMALRLAARLPAHVSADDLINSGMIGLIDAFEKFDPGQGISFSSYAKIRIRGAMLDEIRAMDWVPRSLRQKSNELSKTCLLLEQRLGRAPLDEEIAAELRISCEQLFKLLDEIKGISLVPEDIFDAVGEGKINGTLPSESDEIFQKTYRAELKKHLAEAISSLSKKEQQLLALYYYEELTMKEIGAVMDYTESRISQIHTKAILKLRSRLARKLKREDLPDRLQDQWCEQTVS